MYSITDSLTKIIATIGPASNNRETLHKMILEGLDVCRLNFSHGTQLDHEKTINLVSDLNTELNANVALLADLQGPKLRIGDIKDNALELKEGDAVRFTTEKCTGTAEKIYMSYTQFPIDVMTGDTVLVDDGKLRLVVTDTNRKDMVTLKVLNGGIISSRKGVNLPDTKISLPSLTEKDIDDVKFILKHDIQWIALSFVRTVGDMVSLKDLISRSGNNMKVIAKIEKPEAIDNFDEILEQSDGVMIARGDLGVETPFDKVPLLQKELVRKCITTARPVIIATQMMEGMISNLLPTRAEATDVSNAVLDGADAVMLSGETSIGKYPVDVIRNMQKVVDSTESSRFYLKHEHQPDKESEYFIADSVCYNACRMAELTGATGIMVFTYSGGTAMKIASYRPGAKIFAFTSDEQVKKQLNLVRGVEAFPVDTKTDIHAAVNQAWHSLKSNGLAIPGDRQVIVAGIPMEKREPVNMLYISTVG